MWLPPDGPLGVADGEAAFGASRVFCADASPPPAIRANAATEIINLFFIRCLLWFPHRDIAAEQRYRQANATGNIAFRARGIIAA
jgi:hypothetical protein